MDPQVAAVLNEPVQQSLLDQIIKRDPVDRDPANPILDHVILCGAKDEGDIHSAFEKILYASSCKADSQNLIDEADYPSKATGVTIDYGNFFIMLIEGLENHLLPFFTELCNQVSTNRLKVRDVHVLHLDDDIPDRIGSIWVCIDKVPPSSIVSEPAAPKTEDEILELIAKDINNLRDLLEQGSSESGSVRTIFLENAKFNHAKLFPRTDIIAQYIKSGLFLTIEEFEETFCRFPTLKRDSEALYPLAGILDF